MEFEIASPHNDNYIGIFIIETGYKWSNLLIWEVMSWRISKAHIDQVNPKRAWVKSEPAWANSLEYYDWL